MILFRTPAGSMSSAALWPRGKRSSTAISVPFDEVDRPFGAVGDGEACVALLVRWHVAVAENLAEALVVVAEQVGNKVIAAAMTLTTLGVDPHLHRAVPLPNPMAKLNKRSSDSSRDRPAGRVSTDTPDRLYGSGSRSGQRANHRG